MYGKPIWEDALIAAQQMLMLNSQLLCQSLASNLTDAQREEVCAAIFRCPEKFYIKPFEVVSPCAS